MTSKIHMIKYDKCANMKRYTTELKSKIMIQTSIKTCLHNI